MDNNFNPNANVNGGTPDENLNTDINGNINSLPEEETEENGIPDMYTDSEVPQEGNEEKSADEIPAKKKLSEYFSVSGMARNFKEWWNDDISPGMRTLIIALGVIMAVIIIVVIVALNTSKKVIIYTALKTDEAGEIGNILKDNKIYYKYNPALGTIAVKEKDVGNVTMALAQDGYPHEGYLFTPIQSTGMFQTDSDKLREEQENLRKLIETAIDTLEGVSYSLVILNIPDNKNNILRSEQQQSSVGITVHMKPGQTLSKKAVQGIETLALRSIPNILPENISIIDSTGARLNVDDEDDDTTDIDTRAFLYKLQKQYETEQEALMYEKVMQLVTPILGPDNAALSVDVKSDFDRWIEESVLYDGRNTNEDTGVTSGMVAGEGYDRILSSSLEPPEGGGVVGTFSNIDDPDYNETTWNEEDRAFRDETHLTREYLVDTITKQMEHNTPDIKSATLTLAVNATAEDIEDIEDNLISAMGTASGISALAMRDAAAMEVEFDTEFLRNYITILPMRFYVPPQEGGTAPTPLIPTWIIIAASALLALLLLIVIILILALRKKRIQEEQAQEEAMEGIGYGVEYGEAEAEEESAELDESEREFAEAVAHIRADEEADPDLPPESKERMLKDQILAFTEQNIEIAAQLIRTMIKGEET